jgi:hypothetical protein
MPLIGYPKKNTARQRSTLIGLKMPGALGVKRHAFGKIKATGGQGPLGKFINHTCNTLGGSSGIIINPQRRVVGIIIREIKLKKVVFLMLA